MTYTVVVIHRRSATWMQTIARRIRREVRARHLGATIEVVDVAPTASTGGPIASLYLASPRAARDPTVLEQAAGLAALGAVVVPVITAGQTFGPPFVPRELARINGVRWDGDGVEVIDFLLSALSLRESDRRVFVSYGRRDSDGVARQLWAQLNERGFEVFLDRFSIRPGQDWASRLDAELGDKAFVVIVESDAAAESRWVQHEVTYAMKNHLGLQVVTMPGARADREFAAIPEPYRRRVAASELIGRGLTRRFRARPLSSVLRLIENAHDDALVRRRRYLLVSSLDVLRNVGWTTTPQPDWSLIAERAPDRREFMRIAPRPPRPLDLRKLDAARRRWAGSGTPPIGRLLHEAADLDPTASELMDWVARDRDLAWTQLQDVVAALL